jgi:hypothetical protein
MNCELLHCLPAFQTLETELTIALAALG